MLKICIGLLTFSILMLIMIVRIVWPSSAWISGHITFLDNSRVKSLIDQDRIGILFVEIDHAMYEEYGQRIAQLKQEHSIDSKELCDYIRSIAGPLYYELYEKKRFKYTTIVVNNFHVERFFKVQVKKGFYIVYIFQKGITYFQCLHITDDIALDLEEENLYFW